LFQTIDFITIVFAHLFVYIFLKHPVYEEKLQNHHVVQFVTGFDSLTRIE